MIWFGLVFIGVAYDWATTFWLRRWFVSPEVSGLTNPVTFFRPLKTGVPQIGLKLRSFFAALEPDDQALIGIYEDDFPTQNDARAAVGEFPQFNLQIVLCRRDVARNPKINKLLQIVPFARHEHWIVLDSEIENAAEFLPAFRIDWNSAQFPVLSAPYRFRELTFPTAPVLHTLLPGLAVLQRFGKIQNTLGAAVAVTRAQIEQIGGWLSLGNELAEDYEIGRRLAQLGVPVGFSRAVAALDNDPAFFGSTFRQLHRVSATYRHYQPWGFAGSIVLHSVTWSLLAALFHPLGWIALLLSSISRVIICQNRARLLAWPVSFWKSAFLIPISSILETSFWLLAWLPLPVVWGNRRWYF